MPNYLTEILDNAKRPICLLDAREAARQKLPHRAVAGLAVDQSGQALLGELPGPIFGLTVFAPVRSYFCPQEFAESLLQERLGHVATVESLGVIGPEERFANAFINIFLARYSPGLLNSAAGPALYLSHCREFAGLAEAEMLSPLFLACLPFLRFWLEQFD